MRSKLLKIGNEKREAVLVAGSSIYKIYSVTGLPGWVVASGRNLFTVDEENINFKTVNKYVNLKYQPSSQQQAIKDEFDNFVKAQVPPTPQAETEHTA